jgi:outer membrane protein assembly factor BamB
MFASAATIALVTLLVQPAPSSQAGRPPAASWLQWGGPSRDFQVQARPLGWDGAAPRRVWQRELGDGFSSIVGDQATIYAAWRVGNTMKVAALDPARGTPKWEQSFDSTPLSDMFLSYGQGPNSTPAIGGGRLFVVTFTGRLAALDTATGRVVWTRELWKELKGTFRDVGYSNSPLLLDDLVILPVGGRGRALMAFRQSDGSTAWSGGDLENAMSSPILIDLDGERQIVMLMVEGVGGFDPKTGRQLWFHAHRTDYAVNAATPVWHAPSKTIVLSSAYGSGTRAIRLTRESGRTGATEAWYSRRLRVHHGNMLVLGNHVYGSSGDFGPAPMTSLDIMTGAVGWQSRTFPKASLVQAGGRTIVLDEDGRLAVATLAPTGMTVLQEAQVTTKLSWTAPTLIGTRLYIRDRKLLVAIDLDVTTS